jgi:phosphomannomutase / phosphoglucomutase
MKAPRLFGTNGIRAVAGSVLTPEFAYGIGSCVAELNEHNRILVGRDGRTSSRMLTEGVVSGLLAQGSDVLDCGEITTPGLQFLVKIASSSAGVMVTASHNPPEYNGFKVVDTDGIEIVREKEEKIERSFANKSWKLAKIPGQRQEAAGPIEPYLASLETHVTGKMVTRSLKVVVDTGNGVATLTTPELLRRIGCKVLTMNDNIDGTFPGRTSEPRPENLGPLAAIVRKEKAAFGVAHDGDGDRAMFVDETGVVHSGDKSLTLIADEVLRKNPRGTVVTPLNTSASLREVVGNRKGKLVLTPVGSIHVARTMLQERAILGGEENGGIFYAPHQPVRDGAIATVLILNAIIDNGLSLSKLMARLPNYFMKKEKRTVADEKKEAAIRRLRQKLGRRVTSTLDGVRVDLDHGWFLVRASGTEPLVRIYIEGKTEKDVQRISEEYMPVIDETIQA